MYQTKGAAEAEGAFIRPFALMIEDGDDRALLVRYRAIKDEPTADELMAGRKTEVLAFVETHPGTSQNGVKIGVGGKKEITVEALRQLLTTGVLINRAADKNALALYTHNNDTHKLV